jgi:phytoene/squalene synthetase
VEEFTMALDTFRLQPRQYIPEIKSLPATITKAASQHTYYVIGMLVDRDRTLDAYRAYAYFRWVDDSLDQTLTDKTDRLAFIERQQAIIDQTYNGTTPADLTAEEQMVVSMIRSDHAANSGLQMYIRQMMAVMAFDAERQGRLISAYELDNYTRALATSVTEGLHYFIGHNDPSPQIESRYLAVTAAHITHMLRDTCEDVAAGYFNIPLEFLSAYGIEAQNIQHEAYQEWVRSRVQLARYYFKAGRDYLAQVPNLRCRMAGYAYCVQFERVLDALEQQHYQLCFDDPKERI